MKQTFIHTYINALVLTEFYHLKTIEVMFESAKSFILLSNLEEKHIPCVTIDVCCTCPFHQILSATSTKPIL